MSILDFFRGVKLIYKTGGTRQPENPSMHYKLEANFRPPEIMLVRFISLYGGNAELIIQGISRKALDKLIKANNLEHHPRIKSLTITGPNGVEYQFDTSNKLNSKETKQADG
jgi:hypothetical protein